MTSHIGTRPRTHSLEVRARRTVWEDGLVSTSQTVRCPRLEGSVSVAACIVCRDCEGMHTSEDGSSVRCTYGVAEPEAVHKRRLPSVADRTPLSEVMTGDVLCVRPGVSIEAVAELLTEHGITGVPVVDEAGRAIGVISKTDLVEARHDRLGETAGDIMMPIAFTLPENASLSHAAALMAYEGVHRLPVIATDGSIVGIVSAMDVVRWLARSDGYLVPASPRDRAREEREETP
jgi:CBS domain-containing protein